MSEKSESLPLEPQESLTNLRYKIEKKREIISNKAVHGRTGGEIQMLFSAVM